MPTNFTPLCFHRSYTRSHPGASGLHIGHHGAQKRRITGEPLKSARLTVLPSSGSRVNAGARPGAADACTGRSPASRTTVSASATVRSLDRCLDTGHPRRAPSRTSTVLPGCKDYLNVGRPESRAQKHVKTVGVEVTSVDVDVTTTGAEFTVTIVAVDGVITGTVIVPPPRMLTVAT